MRMTFALRPSLPLKNVAPSELPLPPPFPPSFSDSAEGGLPTRYFTIFLSILIGLMTLAPGTFRLKFAVVAFFQRIEQICCSVHLAVVFDFLIPAHFDFAAIFKRKDVDRVSEVFLF